MTYILQHTVLGFCKWDIPALIVLIVVIVGVILAQHNMKKQEKDLENQLSDLYADDTVQMDVESTGSVEL